jgi:uncharacterized protein involved in response to NO
LLFLSAVLFIILRDIVAGRNWRNLTISVVLAMLTALNVLYHMGEFPVVWLDVLWAAAYAVTMMTALIGGTVMESFTGNALTVGTTGFLI